MWGIGAVIENRYRIETVLHDGPRSWIAAASALALGKRVAIKALKPQASDPIAIERFINSARSASSVASPHVIDIHDFGLTDRETPYVVQEYLDGIDLAALLRRGGPLEPAFAIDLLLQLCEGADAIHAAGFVHRAIEPANVIVIRRDTRPFLKLIDFFYAREIGAPPPPGPPRGVAIGTPPYAAPEQLRDPPSADERADIWSAGVLGWELLTGRAPVIVDGAGAQLPEIVSPRLVAILRRCLAHDRAGRYRTMAELAAALSPLATPR